MMTKNVLALIVLYKANGNNRSANTEIKPNVEYKTYVSMQSIAAADQYCSF
ncbi:hypothetical protein [Pseudoalteromonas phenolica]|uniref:hypothetical protein n=1 Tax=Pseudoalteromonas phenolica TaxID=161398 RepID=UPI001A048B57|nr:hypothetical protein [Pseudoalteromonas phenolica]MBE0356771.1 hypothetical protein [Pseudoalteromonas phenolica O-BC30]